MTHDKWILNGIHLSFNRILTNKISRYARIDVIILVAEEELGGKAT